jgi:hypothetical protein
MKSDEGLAGSALQEFGAAERQISIQWAGLDGEGPPVHLEHHRGDDQTAVQVDEAFAWNEGEGDRTRDWWLAAHRRYFAR